LFDKIKTYLSGESEGAVFNVLLAVSTALFMLQILSLYTTPVPDSYLWWGDESWLMLEFRTQILEGVFRHPYALGSSLEHGSGLLFGNMWVSALLYGAPATLLKGGPDIILIGRTVTALLAVSLLGVLYEIIRRLTSDRSIAMFGVILLLTSRSFLLTSHSARYDILTALCIVLGFYFLIRANAPLRTSKRSAIIGFCAAATLLVTVHVTLAIGLAAFIGIVWRSRTRRLGNAGAFLGGASVFGLILLGLSAFRSQTSLFGSASANAFTLNILDIPALRLFSRSVQFANVTQRLHTFAFLGMGYLVVIGFLAVLAIIGIATRWKNASASRETWATAHGYQIATIGIVLVSWLEFESSAPTSYLIYVLPVLSVCAALLSHWLLPIAGRSWMILAASVVLCFFGFKDAPWPRGAGYHIASANDHAVNEALAQVSHGIDNPRPLVLAFNPAVHDVLHDTSIRLMTTHFIEFPISNGEAPDYTIRKNRVLYILLYRSALKPDYMREVGPLSEAAHHLGSLVWQQAGVFTDIGRSYFGDKSELHEDQPDTLQLYHIYE
jgi:hypothetical protein